MLHVEILHRNTKDLQPFIQLPFDLYKGDSNWAPPVRRKLLDSLLSDENDLLAHSQPQFFIAYQGDTPIARVMAGMDTHLGEGVGWFSLFESEDNMDGVRAVLDAACAYLKEKGATQVVGPIAPQYDLLNRGLLVDAFDGLPVLHNPYNKAYYPALLEGYGFVKKRDYLAYQIPIADVPLEKMEPLAQKVEQRFNFRVEQIPSQRLGLRLAREIASIIAKASKATGEDVPTPEDIQQLLERLKTIYRGELCVMAYAGEKPIGVVLAFPDNTPYLQALDGVETPLRVLKAVLSMKNVTTVRCPMQSVVPEYQSKAVNLAMIHHAISNAKRLGYTYIEGSTVPEDDVVSINNTLLAGGRHYRTYRVYTKDL